MNTSRPTPEYGAPWLPITSTGRPARPWRLELVDDQEQFDVVDGQEEKVPEVLVR